MEISPRGLHHEGDNFFHRLRRDLHPLNHQTYQATTCREQQRLLNKKRLSNLSVGKMCVGER